MIYIVLSISYLLGSVNFAIIISKYKGIDIKNEGSGNPGSSNALRVLGKKYAAGVLAGDMLKGIISVALGIFLVESVNPFMFGLASVLGHCFPIYHKFRGGKGVATFLGSYLGYLILVPSTKYTESFKFIRISALASLFTIIISGYFVITDTNNTSVQIGTVLMILIIIFQHRSNIGRLLKGNENKF